MEKFRPEVDVEAMHRRSRWVALALIATAVLFLLVLAAGWLPHAGGDHGQGGHGETVENAVDYVPPLWAVAPFAGILLAIAFLPLIRRTAHWWHSNLNRFAVAACLGIVTLFYYFLLHPGGISNHFTHAEHVAAGFPTVWAAFSNAIFAEFIPFIILLFALYVISGGVSLTGDLQAHPIINTSFLATGTLLASFIGTTGAAMVLIRPLLSTNRERRKVRHTVIFFIFTVCNCGGLLLPIGDPPLFLGYLRGVPFTWTLDLWPYWVGVNVALLVIYYIWDRIEYGRERPEDLRLDRRQVRSLRLRGTHNLVLLGLVVLCVAFVVPGKPLLGTSVYTPVFLRETLMCLLVAVSLLTTRPATRAANDFNYHAILEVAALFSGIFITMQVPIEILHARGADLGLNSGAGFFWITGVLSSFLDNAPTYVVFFETAVVMEVQGAATVALGAGRTIAEPFLIAISLGAVFMGANSYIGNGPNFMVKSIAEQSGVRMPSFFGYMLYSLVVLVPIFVVITFIL
ncbi:MAG TPA: sodium:proton antiporter [Acidobacteriota bacterium]|nr:sodium:proton antiporter [Acidobacteriota bacterium]